MPVEIRRMTNRSAGFYPLIGPFLARRSIADALGGPTWDDDGKEWFVALDAGAVVGFAAAVVRRESVLLCSAYVPQEHRGRGVYQQLLRARLDAHRGARFVATATEMSRSVLARAGFQPIRPKGRFTVMEMTHAS